MTSIEIAEITGKPHNDVMKAIRKMEPAWARVNEGNFSLVNYRDKKGEVRPCYSLTKTECLYIATKFNDEARAKLVLRWKELEEERLRKVQPMSDLDVMCRAVLILKRNVEELDQQVTMLQPKADYVDEVLESVDCLTMTQVAKGLGMTARELTNILLQQGIIYQQSGQYMLYAPYARQQFARNRTHTHRDLFGDVHTQTYLVWTERGREFIHKLFKH